MFLSFYVQDIAIMIVKKGWLYSLNKVADIFGWAGDKKALGVQYDESSPKTCIQTNELF